MLQSIRCNPCDGKRFLHFATTSIKSSQAAKDQALRIRGTFQHFATKDWSDEIKQQHNSMLQRIKLRSGLRRFATTTIINRKKINAVDAAKDQVRSALDGKRFQHFTTKTREDRMPQRVRLKRTPYEVGDVPIALRQEIETRTGRVFIRVTFGGKSSRWLLLLLGPTRVRQITGFIAPDSEDVV